MCLSCWMHTGTLRPDVELAQASQALNASINKVKDALDAHKGEAATDAELTSARDQLTNAINTVSETLSNHTAVAATDMEVTATVNSAIAQLQQAIDNEEAARVSADNAHSLNLTANAAAIGNNAAAIASN